MKVTENFVTGAMFADYVDWRAKHPSDDIMTELLHVEFADETGNVRNLTRNELLTYLEVLAGAGNETTTRLIGWSAKVLADHPDQRAQLVADPSLIANAVEEVLRFESPAPHVGRCIARADLGVHGVSVPAGSVMLFLLGSANRDDRRFPDGDSFDIHRKGGRHLTFGNGIHLCMGSALARMEGCIALEEVLARFPEWDIDIGQRAAVTDVDRSGLGDPAGLRRIAPVTMPAAPVPTPRPYESPLRRQRAVETRERIIAAGCRLLQSSSVRDWHALTIRGAADEAGVNETNGLPLLRERTGTPGRGDAPARAGGRSGARRHAARGPGPCGSPHPFPRVVVPSSAQAPLDPTLTDANLRQRTALLGALEEPTAPWPEEDRIAAAALFDVLWSVATYERLVSDWDLDRDQAIRTVTWAIGLIGEAVSQDRRPSCPGAACLMPPRIASFDCCARPSLPRETRPPRSPRWSARRRTRSRSPAARRGDR